MKLNSSRAGHDKLVRLPKVLDVTGVQVRTAQYACRLVAASQVAVSPQAKQLGDLLATNRKLLRLGTCVDALNSSLATVGHPDLVIRLTVTLARISSAMFLFTDHLLWLHRANLVRLDVAKWSNLSDRCWLYGSLLSLARDVYEVQRALERWERRGRRWDQLLPDNRALLVDVVKNCADTVLPLAALGNPPPPHRHPAGYIRAPRLAGLLGIVSSLAAALPLLYPRLRI